MYELLKQVDLSVEQQHRMAFVLPVFQYKRDIVAVCSNQTCYAKKRNAAPATKNALWTRMKRKQIQLMNSESMNTYVIDDGMDDK